MPILKENDIMKWRYPKYDEYPETESLIYVNIVIENTGCKDKFVTIPGYYSKMTKCFHRNNNRVIDNVIAWSYLPKFPFNI